jgi:FAD:protein FMN transferase
MASNANSLQRFEAVEPLMGTLFGLTLYVRSAAEARTAFEAAFARAAALNRLFSDYLPDSEVSRLDTTARPVSTELWRILRFARDLSRRTNGAFDVTVGPLTRLWRERKPLTPEARALVDWRELHLSRGTVRLGKPGMRVDLGAIGKGFAADEMRRILNQRGISRLLIAASGDIVCGDPPPGQRGWSVHAAGRTLTLRRAAVSTSGDTTQFFVQDGRRLSHILDPRSGASLTDLLEVAVVAPNGMIADALSTATRVLGHAAAGPVLRAYKAKALA